MRDSCTPLYPNDQVAAKVTEYAEKHSSPIPQHMRDVHAYTSANDPDHANFMISTLQAQFQIWMAKALGSKRILEIGCYIGFSALGWSEAVGPEGLVTSLEFVPEYAETAKKNWEKNGAKNIEVIVGDARESIKTLTSKLTEPYDLIFVDADKGSYPTYFELILELSKPSSTQTRLLRPGGFIVADNILRRGLVADPSDANPAARAIARDATSGFKDNDKLDAFNKLMVQSKRLDTFLMPMFDGLGMGRLLD